MSSDENIPIVNAVNYDYIQTENGIVAVPKMHASTENAIQTSLGLVEIPDVRIDNVISKQSKNIDQLNYTLETEINYFKVLTNEPPIAGSNQDVILNINEAFASQSFEVLIQDVGNLGNNGIIQIVNTEPSKVAFIVNNTEVTAYDITIGNELLRILCANKETSDGSGKSFVYVETYGSSEQVDTNTQSIENIENEQKVQNNRLTDVEVVSSNNATNIATNATNISVNGTNITALQGNFSDLQTDVSDLQTEVSDLQTDVSDLQDGQVVQDNRITAVEGVASTNATNISVNGTNITALQGNFSDLQTDVSDIQDEQIVQDNRLTAVESLASTNQADITQLQSDTGDLGNVYIETIQDNEIIIISPGQRNVYLTLKHDNCLIRYDARPSNEFFNIDPDFSGEYKIVVTNSGTGELARSATASYFTYAALNADTLTITNVITFNGSFRVSKVEMVSQLQSIVAGVPTYVAQFINQN